MKAIVLGAGIIGAATARAAAEQGHEVVLLEAFSRGHDRGSSHGETRIFRHSYAHRDYVELALHAETGWRRLEEVAGLNLLDPTGGVDHGAASMLTDLHRTMSQLDIPSKMLSNSEAKRRWPGFRFDGDVLFSSRAGRLRADTAIDTLLRVAHRGGADLRFGEPVVKVDVDADGVTVRTAGGIREADRLIVAAGSWTPQLVSGWLHEHGMTLPPLRITEEQPAHFPAAGHFTQDDWPCFVHHPSDPSAHEAYGMFTPGKGVKVGLHGYGAEVRLDSRDRAIDGHRLRALQGYVAEWLPGVDASRPEAISCIYDNTPTQDFVLDRVGPVAFATGFSGHGFKFGPAVGDVLARLAFDGVPPAERFRISRPEFPDPHRGEHTIQAPATGTPIGSTR